MIMRESADEDETYSFVEGHGNGRMTLNASTLAP